MKLRVTPLRYYSDSWTISCVLWDLYLTHPTDFSIVIYWSKLIQIIQTDQATWLSPYTRFILQNIISGGCNSEGYFNVKQFVKIVISSHVLNCYAEEPSICEEWTAERKCRKFSNKRTCFCQKQLHSTEFYRDEISLLFTCWIRRCSFLF